MFDAETDCADTDVCRDEFCDVDFVHPSHIYPLTEQPKKGRPKRPWWERREPGAAARQDPDGLVETLRRLFELTDWPLAFRDISMAVTNDYGSVSTRTLHRYVRYLIGELQFIEEIDLGLAWLVYIRADSRRRHDRANLREYVLGMRAGASVVDRPWSSIGAGTRAMVRHA